MDTWKRSGISLLWDPAEVGEIVMLDDIVSIRQYMHLYQTEWPEDLPSLYGDVLVVAGLDTVMDLLAPDDLVYWFESKLYPSLLSFQSMYEGQCALIFWLPDSQKRIELKTDGIFYWKCIGTYQGEEIPLSTCLWNGAAINAQLITKNSKVFDVKDKGCIGIFHRRIS
ncbi:hypothetical protein [Neobacillus niacini]|uniref:hypothetical protein n=1 Tax=Neobacillus niacini TaxID=86668 RepID=UPI00398375C4